MTVLATISVKNNAGKTLSIKLRLVSIAASVRLPEKKYCIVLSVASLQPQRSLPFTLVSRVLWLFDQWSVPRENYCRTYEFGK